MKNCFSGIFRYLTLLVLALSMNAGADAAGVQKQPPVRLSGHIPTKAVAKSVFLANLEASVNVPLTFTLPLRNQDELETLLQSMYDPENTEHYHKYLTTEDFHNRFAPTQADYDKVIAYAKSLGLTVTGTHPNRTLVNVAGKTRSVESAFNLRLKQYQLPSGRKFYAPNNNPQVSADIASVISGVVGLDNHAVWHPNHRKKETTGHFEATQAGSQASPSGPGGGYAPADLITAYGLTGMTANGSGQIIALFELASYQASDINAYTSNFGLPTAQLKNILVDGGSGAGIDPEVTLDIELALALAPQSQIYVYEGPNSNQGVLDTYNKIATDNIAKQVSTSWGMGEDNEAAQYLQSESAIFQQMAAQGQTIYAAAGDSGAYDDSSNNSNALVVDDPASQPYVCGVGGTKLSVDPSSGAYASEVVWNEGAGNGAGGGGVSTVWTIPSWQANVATSYSKTNRNVPDVALNADPNSGYSIYYNGQWTTYGGTSCAAPLWASFTACVNQVLTADKNPTLGFVNPALYKIASGSAYSANFHDITQGDNLYYAAGAGYDNATGLGSFIGLGLFTSLTSGTNPPPQDLSLLMKHLSPFPKGGTGTYTIVVQNKGNSPTNGPVSVAVTLPAGLTYKSFTGSGWSFDPATLTCTENNPLQALASYTPIKLTVSVSNTAPYTVIPTATLSGGGSATITTTNRTTTR